MAGIEQGGGMRAGLSAVGSDHHTLTGGQPVVFDHPGGLTGGRAEPVQGSVEMGRTVDSLAGSSPHPRGRHHILGEGLRTLDAGRVLGRTEAGDTRRADRVGHAECQRHLRADHHQVDAQPGCQRGDFVS